MTKTELQIVLEDNGVKVKVLWVEPIDPNDDDEVDYWIVYTENLNYCPFGRDYSSTKHLVANEKDIIATSIEEAVEFIKNPVIL